MRALRVSWVVLLGITLLAAPALAGVHADRIGSSGPDAGRGVAVDAAGNVYTTGAFSGTLRLGGFTLVSRGGQDLFVGKQDTSGNWLWVRSAGGASGDDAGRAVAVDAEGNVYVTGVFQGQAAVGSTVLHSSQSVQVLLDPAALTFTPANWDTPRTVTVTAVDDTIPEGDHTESVLHSSTSDDGAYATDPGPTLSVRVVDNDSPPAPAVVTAESGGTAASEDGTVNDSYTVVLSSQPSADVILTLTFDAAQVSVSPTQLTFTSANWSTPQAVSVSAVDDDVDEADEHTVPITHTAASADDGYDGLTTTVTVTVTDDDTAGVTVAETGGSTAVDEDPAGTPSDTYTVVLDSEPTADVTVTLTVSRPGQITVDAGTLTFTPADWDTPRTVTVTAVDDADWEGGAHEAAVVHTAASADPLYDDPAIAAVTVGITDDEADDGLAHVWVTQTGGYTSVSEAGGTDTYEVVLAKAPTADVTVAIGGFDAAQVAVSPAALTFTAANWGTPQAVTVSALDDGVPEHPHPGETLTHTVASADAAYDGIGVEDVAVFVTDDDTPGVSVTVAGADLTEGGAAGTVTLVLGSEPAADVTVTVSASDPGEVAFTGAAELTFTPADWDTPQTVGFEAVDDAAYAPPRAAALTYAVSSTDTDYQGFAIPQTPVSITDDDPGIVITPSGGETVVSEEGQTSDTYTVRLNTQPTADVTVYITTAALASSPRSALVASLDPEGSWRWAKVAAGGGLSEGNGIGVDGAGDVIVAGTASADASLFGSLTVGSNGRDDLFVAKLGPGGSWVWARKFGTSGDDQGHGLAVDAQGSIYVAGRYAAGDAATTNTAPLWWLFIQVGEYRVTTTYKGQDIALLKLGPDGALAWASFAGGSGPGEAALGVDLVQTTGTAGFVYLTGEFADRACFGGRHRITTQVWDYYNAIYGADSSTTTDGCDGGTTLLSAGGTDLFVARYSTEGALSWARRVGTGAADSGAGVAVDPDGSAYVTGLRNGRAFAGRWDAAGNTAWAPSDTGDDDPGTPARGRGVALDPGGAPLVVGTFEGSASFDDGLAPLVMTSAGASDGFVARLDPLTGRWANDRVRLAITVREAGGGPYGYTGSEPSAEPGGVPGFPPGSRWYPTGTEVTARTPFLDGSSYLESWEGTGSVVREVERINDLGQTVTDVYTSGQETELTFTLLEDSTLTWTYEETEILVVGQAVEPPPEAALVLPEIEIRTGPPGSTAVSSFFWSDIGGGADPRLYGIRPVTAEIGWWYREDPADPGSYDPGDERRIVRIYTFVWPESPIVHVAGSFPVELQPEGTGFTFASLSYTEQGTGAVVPNRKFQATGEGYSVIMYTEGPVGDITSEPVVFDVVRTVLWDDEEAAGARYEEASWPIGEPITDDAHTLEGENGYVLHRLAPIDASGPDAAYDFATRTGQIIPVGTVTDRHEPLVVVWYDADNDRGVPWPVKWVRYTPEWPGDAGRIVIASGKGSELDGQPVLDPAVFPEMRIYDQPDPAEPGFNPNDEHALFAPSNTGTAFPALFALRSDLTDYSDPYVLLKYRDGEAGGWAFRVYRVAAEEGEYTFRYDGTLDDNGERVPFTAGKLIQAPYPVSLFQPACGETFGSGTPYWEDWKGSVWARSAGTVVTNWYYPLQEGYFYDLDLDGTPDREPGECVAWLGRLGQAELTAAEALGLGLDPADPLDRLRPVDVTYEIEWPADAAVLAVGETLLTPKRGLPDILNQAAAEVIFDETDPDIQRPLTGLARLIDPLSERWVALEALPSDVPTEDRQGMKVFPDLPFSLRSRLHYDPLNRRLVFGGVVDQSVAGDPLVLLNVMTRRERDRIQALSADPDWAGADGIVAALYVRTRNPGGLDLDGDGSPDDALLVGMYDDPARTGTQAVPEPLVGIPKALTAGLASGTGYLTLAFNNDPSLQSLPVSLEIIRIGCPVYTGEIKVIGSDNVFDEKLTLRHSGDFGGDPDRLSFEWYYHPDEGGPPDLPPDPDGGQLRGWIRFGEAGPGVVDITIEGPGLLTISDNWFFVRYRGYGACGGADRWSGWGGAPGSNPQDLTPQLAPGWIKRVVSGLNPFEARVKDFHKAETNTFASMIVQAGERYEGPIPFSGEPDAINDVGLIEAYTTVLDRGKDLSIDAVPPVDYGPANNSLLLAASRVADLYMLLGNEAFADAQDPTIGFGTDSGEYGTLAPSIFAFENQLDSLLEEELVLLRGRDPSGAPVGARPVYNRLFWNFTMGEGEVAYSQVYNISDQNGDGLIDEYDARILYPQGHGDAWGHYLTALTTYYDLLRHPNYTWVPRAESVLVAGVPVQVDFLDERKFAKAAAAKARAGAQIVDLTYRRRYVEDPAGQWQGYKDTDPDRAWGLSEWARRAGQGAYFDWVVGNAVLPDEDPDPGHVGIQRIDRTTVGELSEIAAQFRAVQAQLDKADLGLNPLGLAKGVVPFDIDPTRVADGETHFEQVYERALESLGNAVQVFNYANQQSELLRRGQDSLDDFAGEVDDRERDYTNRLIEIFGYPYADDIGPGGTYPSGYAGPDLYHYMYVDPSELTGSAPPPTQELRAYFTPIQGLGFWPGDDANAETKDQILEVTYTLSLNGYGLVRPEGWTGRRRAPGELQFALSDLYQARGSFEKALVEYKNHIRQIQDALELLRAHDGVRDAVIALKSAQLATVMTMNSIIEIAESTKVFMEKTREMTGLVGDATAEALPTSVGVATDVAAPARGAIKLTATITETGIGVGEAIAEGVKLAAVLAKEVVEGSTEIAITAIEQNFEVQQRLKELEQMVRQEAEMRLELFTLREVVKQSAGRYLTTLAAGERLIEELVAFRQGTAAEVQEYRYQDMAFRIFRNDALQKYRAQFDLAARYVYLAATAYDYETNLLGSDRGAGQKFLTDVVRQRSLGQMADGEPVAGGTGLADILARMGQNFQVYKGQLGFNNPQTETNRFSLRSELLRLRDTSDGLWRDQLARYRVPDLWAVPEFRRYCRPFAPEEGGAQPGLVIPFSTTITFGRNFFGWPLGGGDSAYDPTNFATKIRSVGVWFTDYDGAGLSLTPRVYLIPVGADVLRSPTGNTFATREWKVIDQALPVPFPIGASDLRDSDWIPLNDTLSEELAAIRRFSSFRAYHDSGEFEPDETISDSRLIGRSVWNTRWLLIIPGGTLLADPDAGLDAFVKAVSDIKIFFQTYAYSGN